MQAYRVVQQEKGLVCKKKGGGGLKQATPSDNNRNGYSHHGNGKMDIESDNYHTPCCQPQPSASQPPAHQSGTPSVALAPTQTCAPHTQHEPHAQVPFTMAIFPSHNPCSQDQDFKTRGQQPSFHISMQARRQEAAGHNITQLSSTVALERSLSIFTTSQACLFNRG